MKKREKQFTKNGMNKMMENHDHKNITYQQGEDVSKVDVSGIGRIG